MNRNRLPIHAVVDNQDPRFLSSVNPENVLEEPDEEESGEPDTLLEALQAVLNKARGNGGRFQKRPGASRPPPNSRTTTTRGPRCANCGGAHNKTECPKPTIDVSQRTCFNCGKTGHQANKCPEGGKPNSAGGRRRLKALSDLKLPMFGLLDESVDRFGFQPIINGARPRPQNAVLGDLLSNLNRFEALIEDKARNKIVGPAKVDNQ